MRLPCLFGYGCLCLSSSQIGELHEYEYLWKESNDLSFSVWRQSSKKDKMWDCHFLLFVVCVCDPIRLKDSLISNKTWKDQLITLNFLRGNNHQGKVAFKTTTHGWVWLGRFLNQSDDSLIVNISEGNNWYLFLK